MPKALSLDLRTRVVQAYLNGTETQQQVADRFGVGVAPLVRWLRLQRESGSLKPRPSDGAPAPKLDANGLQVLAGLVAEQNDLTNAEYAMQLEDLLGITCTSSPERTSRDGLDTAGGERCEQQINLPHRRYHPVGADAPRTPRGAGPAAG